MTGVAIHEARAVAALIGAGLVDYQAREALDLIGPASTMDGARYFMAADVDAARHYPALALDGAPARASRSGRFYLVRRADGRGGDVEFSAAAFRRGLAKGAAFRS
jgi:hypothetical protein